MRRILTLIALLLLPVTAAAQSEIIPALFINSAGVARGPILAPDGSAAAPSYSFANHPTSGLFTNAGNVNVSVLGTARAQFGASQLALTPSDRTGSTTTSAFTITQTLNTTGVVDGVFRMSVTNTASGVGSYLMALYGGAAGATPLFRVDMTGVATAVGFQVGATPGIDKTCGGPVISATFVKGILTAMTCTS